MLMSESAGTSSSSSKMSDDLSSFFAKKSQRAIEKKKKGVVKIDEVGHQLERKAKRQEERDREDEEEEKRAISEENFLRKQTTEDSEWLDYNEVNAEIRLSEFGIKDMNLTEQVEEDEQEEKTTPSEPTRTWNLPTPHDENRAPNAATAGQQHHATPTAADTQAAYVPMHARRLRSSLMSSTATPDISNQEMFPSLAAAEKIEKNQRDVEKRHEQRRLEQTADKPGKTMSSLRSDDERQDAMNAVRNMTSSITSHPAAPTTPAAVESTGPARYIPPSQRRGGATASSMQTPHTATTNNRFDSLQNDN